MPRSDGIQRLGSMEIMMIKTELLETELSVVKNSVPRRNEVDNAWEKDDGLRLAIDKQEVNANWSQTRILENYINFQGPDIGNKAGR